MLNDKLRADLDQGQAIIAEVWPPVWRSLYNSCLSEGFSEDESMQLVKTFILSMGNAGVKGP